MYLSPKKYPCLRVEIGGVVGGEKLLTDTAGNARFNCWVASQIIFE